MDQKMFCYQCEQTAGCAGCTGNAGVCGKTARLPGFRTSWSELLSGLREQQKAWNVRGTACTER